MLWSVAKLIHKQETNQVQDERAMPNYSWIRDEIPSTPDTSSARELHWLEGAFSEYQAALMDKREVIEKFDFHRRKLKGALEKTERFIAAKKSEYIHLGINPATKTFGLRQLEERKRQVEEAMKKLESETTLGNDGSSLKRPRSTNASFNSAFSPRRGHNPSFSL